VSDEELRELARDETPSGALRLARALERLGRRDEALEALLPHREDAEVRRALGGFPAWTHVFGDALNTRSVDVEPVRTAPRIKWSVPGLLDPERTTRLSMDFVANPLVVVATRTESSVVALDAETGAVRWQRDFVGADDGAVSLQGDAVLFAEEFQVTFIDAWSGHECSRGPGQPPIQRQVSATPETPANLKFVLRVLAPLGQGHPFRLVAEDRRSGELVENIAAFFDWATMALARGVLYFYFAAPAGMRGGLRAFPLDGSSGWWLPPTRRAADVFAIAPAHRRLYTLARDGTVTCFEEPPPRPSPASRGREKRI
jgi:hypothetical protein